MKKLVLLSTILLIPFLTGCSAQQIPTQFTIEHKIVIPKELTEQIKTVTSDVYNLINSQLQLQQPVVTPENTDLEPFPENKSDRIMITPPKPHEEPFVFQGNEVEDLTVTPIDGYEPIVPDEPTFKTEFSHEDIYGTTEEEEQNGSGEYLYPDINSNADEQEELNSIPDYSLDNPPSEESKTN